MLDECWGLWKQLHHINSHTKNGQVLYNPHPIGNKHQHVGCRLTPIHQTIYVVFEYCFSLFFYLRSMIRSSIVLISPFHGEGFKSTKKITLGHRHRIPSKSASRAKVRSKGKAALATNQHVGGGWTNMYWIISPRIGGIGVKILKKSNNHLEHPDCHHPCFSSNEKIAPFPPPKSLVTTCLRTRKKSHGVSKFGLSFKQLIFRFHSKNFRGVIHTYVLDHFY